MATIIEEEIENTANPIVNPLHSRPVLIRQRNSNTDSPFLSRPLLGALLFTNENSDCRDHCANERTFLSWLRLSTYLAVVAVAIVLSFHLKSQPTAIEKKVAIPLGVLFWLLSLACLTSGFANYVNTVTSYSRRAALVQSGWKTQLVFTVVAVAIVGCCGLFLGVDAQKQASGRSVLHRLSTFPHTP